MDTPKISVLIPLYNRKNFIEQCLDSVLAQTFRDFEVIVRDDCSTDGSPEFIRQKYAAEISAGRLKLLRNEKNLGEHQTENRLFSDATGKYFAVLHNDDLYLPHALAHLYEVAETFKADVVHACGFLNSPKDGVIKNGTKLHVVRADRRPVNKVELVSNEPADRFAEYFFDNTFLDLQYNLFNRKFILENEIFNPPAEGGHRFFSLLWIMTAKIFVKTPVVFYIRRDSPYSQTNEKNLSPDKVAKLVAERIELSKYLDEILQRFDFFKDNEELQLKIKMKAFAIQDDFYLKSRGIYNQKISAEFDRVVRAVFKKYFGEDFFYPLFLFYRAHAIDVATSP